MWNKLTTQILRNVFTATPWKCNESTTLLGITPVVENHIPVNNEYECWIISEGLCQHYGYYEYIGSLLEF